MVINLLYLAHDQEKGYKPYCDDGGEWYEGAIWGWNGS
jgi:hypothetical protein